MHLSLGIWVMIATHTLQNAKAEITCASCPLPVQLQLAELQLDRRTGQTQGPGALKQIRLEFRQLGVTDRKDGVNNGQQEGASVEDVPKFSANVSLDGVSAKEDTPWSPQNENTYRSDYNEMIDLKARDAALRRAKRSGPEFSEFSESGWTGRARLDADASDERSNPGPLLDGHRLGRSEFKGNRDEGRGNNRQDEPKLTSSTFALTGDSAHNHAVVYWSGQNSSVSQA